MIAFLRDFLKGVNFACIFTLLYGWFIVWHHEEDFECIFTCAPAKRHILNAFLRCALDLWRSEEHFANIFTCVPAKMLILIVFWGNPQQRETFVPPGLWGPTRYARSVFLFPHAETGGRRIICVNAQTFLIMISERRPTPGFLIHGWHARENVFFQGCATMY